MPARRRHSRHRAETATKSCLARAATWTRCSAAPRRWRATRRPGRGRAPPSEMLACRARAPGSPRKPAPDACQSQCALVRRPAAWSASSRPRTVQSGLTARWPSDCWAVPPPAAPVRLPAATAANSRTARTTALFLPTATAAQAPLSPALAPSPSRRSAARSRRRWNRRRGTGPSARPCTPPAAYATATGAHPWATAGQSSSPAAAWPWAAAPKLRSPAPRRRPAGGPPRASASRPRVGPAAARFAGPLPGGAR
mmetsp:Transcript_86426/g.220211  ORF Transcript_86426/g.220211 Transcript_86426/m.220211 type:complete len:254 (-) Transcript_86426:311-1072(-)